MQRDALEKMAAMSLGKLPVESIGVPESSPLIHSDIKELTTTLDISRRLSDFFPVYFAAALYELQSLLARAHVQAYVVGGITRDLLLYKEKRLHVQDVDITIEGNALEVAQFLVDHSRNFCLTESHEGFGTVRVNYKNTLIFDFASTRREVYPSCGALPEVIRQGVPLVDDIVRRDFTINALAISIHELGKILDYTNGIEDIETGQIRVLHPASFFEDPSRILRAFKFASRLGFALSPETQHLLETFLKYGSSCYKGGGERIKAELCGFLSEEETPAKQHHLEYFIQNQCLKLTNMTINPPSDPATVQKIMTASEKLPEISQAFSEFTYKEYPFHVYLCFLLEGLGPEELEGTIKRLGLTKLEREIVEKYLNLKNTQAFSAIHEFSSPVDIYTLFHRVPFPSVIAMMIHTGLETPSRLEILMEAFQKYKRKWEGVEIELDGNDLLELGVPKGPLIGKLMQQLLHARLIGRAQDRLSEIQFIKQRIEDERIALASEVNKTKEAVDYDPSAH